MSRAGRRSIKRPLSTKGFTLVELVIVLVIMGMIALLSFPVFSRSINGLGLKRGVQEMTAALRYAREAAIVHQSPSWLAFDIEEDQYLLGDGRADETAISGDLMDRAIKLHANASLEGFNWFDGRRADKFGWVEFYPNGSSSGGTLFLKESDGERMKKIVLEPFTGLSHVEMVRHVR